MADRDRYGWDRERGRDDWDRDRGYGRGSDRERGYDDRGMMARSSDEVRSWFGDDEARRRREADEFRDRQARPWDYADSDRYEDRDRQWGPNSEMSRREHGWTPSGSERDSQWDRRVTGAPGQGYTYGFGAPNWTGAPRARGDHSRDRGTAAANSRAPIATPARRRAHGTTGPSARRATRRSATL